MEYNLVELYLGILGGQDHPLRQSSQVSLDFLGGPVDLLSLQIRGYQESRVHPIQKEPVKALLLILITIYVSQSIQPI